MKKEKENAQQLQRGCFRISVAHCAEVLSQALQLSVGGLKGSTLKQRSLSVKLAFAGERCSSGRSSLFAVC